MTEQTAADETPRTAADIALLRARLAERMAAVSATKPWIGSALSGSAVKFTDDVTDVGVNHEGTLYVNPTVLADDAPESRTQIETTLGHAALVLLGRGFERGTGRDALAWNTALTQEITEVLSAVGLERPLSERESLLAPASGQPAESLYVVPSRAAEHSEPVPEVVVPAGLQNRLRATIDAALASDTPAPVQDYLARTNGRAR
jgi:hypothetical protein